MSALLIYTLGAFGFAYIVGHSKISLPFRERMAVVQDSDDPSWMKAGFKFSLTLIECCACTGTWFGFIYGLVYGVPGTLSSGWLTGFGLAIYTCGSNLLLAKYAGLMEDE